MKSESNEPALITGQTPNESEPYIATPQTVERIIAEAGIPPRIQRHSLADYDNVKIDWAKGGFFIHGPTGTGKSTLAAAIAIDYVPSIPKHELRENVFGEKIRGDDGKTHALLRHELVPLWIWPRYPILWMNAVKLIRRLQNTFGANARESAGDIIDACANRCGILVIDDLGAQKGSEYGWSTLLEIIDTRIANMRPLIVTSNYGPGKIADLEHDAMGYSRTASRLCELDELLIEGRDMRRQRDCDEDEER